MIRTKLEDLSLQKFYLLFGMLDVFLVLFVVFWLIVAFIGTPEVAFVNNLRQILLSYRNQLAGFKCKSVDWFLYIKSIDLRQEKKMFFGLADFATGFANLFTFFFL